MADRIDQSLGLGVPGCQPGAGDGDRPAPAGHGVMIRIDMIRQDTRHPDKSRRHQGRAVCELDGRRYETKGPGAIYRLSTLLWLHGHGRAEFEVWDDCSPTGRPGGLAMRGRVRNWAYLVKGTPNFTRKANPSPDFTPDEREVVSRAAGLVVDLAKTRAASGLTGAVSTTQLSGGPEHPQGVDRAPAVLASGAEA